MSEVNKSIVRRFVDEVVNRGDLGAIDELLCEEYTDHRALMSNLPSGRNGAKQQYALLHVAFPGLHLSLEQLIADGDRVAFRGVLRGTHQGQFLDIPPTATQIELETYEIMRLSKGRIAEHWGSVGFENLLEILQTHLIKDRPEVRGQ